MMAGKGSEIGAGVEAVGRDQFWLGLSLAQSPMVLGKKG